MDYVIVFFKHKKCPSTNYVITNPIRGAYIKFPDFFFVAPLQQLLEGPMKVVLCKRVNDRRHSLFHLLNCLIKTASELKK